MAGLVRITTSWDDGHVLDHKVADLLDTYDLPGTFYVSPGNVELRPRDRIGPRGARSLAQRFEIGAHTRSHLRLPTLSLATAREEVVRGKAELEDVLGQAVRSFCYPGGAYRPEHVALARDAGFTIARTVKRYATSASPPLEMPTTVHAFRHLVDASAVLRLCSYRVGLACRVFRNWDQIAIRLFDQVLATGGVFHLWGHSWEVEAHDDWERLERVLAHISRRTAATYVSNGELASAAAESSQAKL